MMTNIKLCAKNRQHLVENDSFEHAFQPLLGLKSILKVIILPILNVLSVIFSLVLLNRDLH